jgi:glutathione synthase/RimK-type ligase-like ATP-grasp enzyme
MRYRVIPYRQGSRGASELARGLDGVVLRLQGSRYRPRARDVIINWGNVAPPVFNGVRTLNGTGIRQASNKLEFFRRVSAADPDIIPSFWDNSRDIPDNVYPIVCRTVLAGHSGEGIVIANSPAEVVPAPLYVRYIKKQDEYRIHVGKSGDEIVIIDVQKKARRTDHDNPNWQVRNLANGFIYARENIVAPDCVLDVARRGLACTDLDFGAVDVIYNAHTQRAYVLEVNTAPGITGTTVQNYVNYFRSL